MVFCVSDFAALGIAVIFLPVVKKAHIFHKLFTLLRPINSPAGNASVQW